MYAVIFGSSNPEHAVQVLAQACFGFICHQDPSILMNIDGGVFPLCPRRTGLQIGAFLSFMALSVFARNRIRISGKGAWFVLALPFVAILGHWFLLRLGVLPPDGQSRLLTGLACGSAVGILLAAYRRELSARTRFAPRNTGPLQILALIAAAVGAGLALVSAATLPVLTAIVLIIILVNASLAAHTILLPLSRYISITRYSSSITERSSQ